MLAAGSRFRDKGPRAVWLLVVLGALLCGLPRALDSINFWMAQDQGLAVWLFMLGVYCWWEALPYPTRVMIVNSHYDRSPDTRHLKRDVLARDHLDKSMS